MSLSPRLELRAEQRLALTPEVRLRLSMLRMGPADLDEVLAHEATANPFLRHTPREPEGFARLAEDLLVAGAPSLDEDLRGQIALMALPREVARLAAALVGELDDEGLLNSGALEGLPADLAEAALAALQSCDPVGIGARTAAECLRLQLMDRGLSLPEAVATLAQLGAFARQDWAAAGAALGLDPAGLRARAALLRGLTPRPVLPDRAPVQALRADLCLQRHPDGRIALIPDARSRPRLVLDAALQRRAEAEGFGADLLARARAVLAAVEHRQSTLARIGEWLATAQSGFFDHGPAALVPASQGDLAAALGLHPSTISRALAGKALDAGGRLWPLSAFFSVGLPGAAGPVSARAVQLRIREMIREEPEGQPLSDDEVATKLREQGVDIARRTVAKYRQGLRIPPSSTRRRWAAARQAARGGE